MELELEVLGGEDFDDDDDDEGCMLGNAGGITTGVEACKGVVVSLAQDTRHRIHTLSTPLSTRHSEQVQQCCFDAESSPKPRPTSEWSKTRDYFLR